jgi:hypothetical protein
MNDIEFDINQIKLSPLATRNYAKAKYDSVQKLIANHREEFTEIFTAEKMKYGIRSRPTVAAEKIAKLEAIINQLKLQHNMELTKEVDNGW